MDYYVLSQNSWIASFKAQEMSQKGQGKTVLDTECREMCSQRCLLGQEVTLHGLTAAVINRRGLACLREGQ